MIEDSKGSQPARFLLINLALLGVLIICLASSIVIYKRALAPASAGTPTPTATQRPTLTPSLTFTPSLTPTPTNTPLHTSTPTRTLTPTWTVPPSATPTPIGPATLAPFRPVRESSAYTLKEWSPEDADRAIALMNDYPNTLTVSARGTDDAAYYAAFQYAVTAGKEALLRFPDAPQADRWRWTLAYNLARVGDPDAARLYGEIIARALNSGETEISFLYSWFEDQEPRLALHMIEHQPPSGYLNSYIMEVRGQGSAFVWLLESSSGYRAYALLSAFEFVNPRDAGWIVSELNQNPEDGEELAIFVATGPEQTYLAPPRVFNLSRIPARELPFIQELDNFNIGMEYNNYWAIRADPQDGQELLFRSNVFPPCPVTVRRAYHWNGNYFEFNQAEYSLEEPPLRLGYCDFIAGHAAAFWGPDAAVAIMEELLPDWPPGLDANGDPYPSDALDEWRYRLGVNYALLGDAQAARDYLYLIVNTPSTRLSRWIAPAEEFLKTYQVSGDIYRACQLSTACDPDYAIDYLMEMLPEGQDALTYLRSAGLDTFASGYFDFDGDEVREQWFTIRHRPLESLKFWILAVYPEGVKALFLTEVNTRTPELVYLDAAYISEAALHLQPVVFLDSKLAFSMQRAPGSLQPYLVEAPLRQEYPNRFLEGLQAAEEALFSGGSPEKVKKDLLALAEWPGLLCEPTWSCDPYLYLLGLASELAGDDNGAVEAYHRLWSDYLRSPYTTLARLKLEGGEARPTDTPTQTLTQTLTPTLIGTVTPTLSPTATVTGTPPTATPSLSPTATIPGTTPQPSNTPTPTVTATNPYPGLSTPRTPTPTATTGPTSTTYP